MTSSQDYGSCSFDILFSTSVPAILEKIFFCLDYKSFKTCYEVSTTWRNLLTSKEFKKRAGLKFYFDIEKDEEKLVRACESGNVQKVIKLLSLGLIDVNCSAFLFDCLDFPQTPMGQAAIKGRNEVIKVRMCQVINLIQSLI